jgi:hypothetical protein
MECFAVLAEDWGLGSASSALLSRHFAQDCCQRRVLRHAALGNDGHFGVSVVLLCVLGCSAPPSFPIAIWFSL